MLSDVVHTGGKSPQEGLRNIWTCGMILASAYVLCHLSAMWSQFSDGKKKSKMKVSTNWCITIKYWELSSIEVIFVDY